MSVPRSNLLVWLLIALSIPIGLYARMFQLRLTGDPSFWARFDEMPIMAAMHILGGGTVLLIGGFQFLAGMRSRYINLHRWLGRSYLILVAIGGTGGLVLATSADGGLVARFGFGLLAVVWLFSAAKAYAAIRRSDVVSHRAWMTRNYALAFAAVTLRIYLGVFEVLGVEFESSYPVVAWISWVPNLIAVEWFLLSNLRLSQGVAR
ncbi:MAG: DUF2306 domain-containing protein [Proteobacteria bacterium]|nr:DUF2306 domain-containing protein [Pseudomonadota bacterium]